MAKEETHYVYRFTFPDGKVYIGYTSDIARRWHGDGIGYISNKPMWYAIQECGWDNVKKEILFKLTGEYEEYARKLERKLIKENYMNSYNRSANPEFYKTHDAFQKDRHHPRVFWKIGGSVLPASEWCKRCGKNYGVVSNRFQKYEMTIETALKEPEMPNTLTGHAAVEYWESRGFKKRKKPILIKSGRRPNGDVIVIDNNGELILQTKYSESLMDEVSEAVRQKNRALASHTTDQPTL